MQSLEKKRLENTLVWSAHRAKTLGTCARKYYYNYIGSWEGWESGSPPQVQAAYRLKHLTTVELQIGQMIHDRIRSIFESARHGLKIHPAKEIEAVQGRFQNFLMLSAKRRLEDCSAKCPKLMVHEMGETLGAKELEALNDNSAEMVKRYYKKEISQATMVAIEWFSIKPSQFGKQVKDYTDHMKAFPPKVGRRWKRRKKPVETLEVQPLTEKGELLESHVNRD